MSKPDSDRFSRLVDWLDGHLSAEESHTLADEVNGADESLQADIAWLKHFRRASETLVIGSPPHTVRVELERRFQAFAEGRRPPGLFQRLLAVLSWDSHSQWATAGARSAATQGLERQMIFTAAGMEIVLNVEPRQEARQVNLVGQIFADDGPDAPPRTVQLLREMAEIAITATDEMGEFEFEAVPPGEYELIVTGEQLEVLLAPITLEI